MKLFVHDQDWQYPAITEKHAYDQIKDFHEASGDLSVAYLAFPWATLIDIVKTAGRASAVGLISKLKILGDKISKSNVRHVITTCQHIRLIEFAEFFLIAGVTDIFWSHCTKGLETLPVYPKIRLHPFPLFPVQHAEIQLGTSQKDVLFSFVGARSNDWYLTSSRQYIIDLLQKDQRGIVVGRDNWHYNRVVYDHQIKKKIGHNEKIDLINSDSTNEFKDILQRSIFSLCPSGTGPNSIRLWEAIGSCSIPVILADTYLPPGDMSLWQEAAIFCEESEEAIRRLPDQLAAMAEDNSVIQNMIHAGRQLWLLYGPESFVYDIKKLILQFSHEESFEPINQVNLDLLNEIALKIIQDSQVDSNLYNYFLISCSTKILTAPADFRDSIIGSSRINEAAEISLKFATDEIRNQFFKVKTFFKPSIRVTL